MKRLVQKRRDSRKRQVARRRYVYERGHHLRHYSLLHWFRRPEVNKFSKEMSEEYELAQQRLIAGARLVAKAQAHMDANPEVTKVFDDMFRKLD